MKTVVVLSGAGLSAESGLPTFRDTNGLWENHKVEDIAYHSAWPKNQELMLKFYNERYNSYKGTEPNAAHKAIARLEEKYKVINVTQNIDGLLEQAGCTDVRHIHGSIFSKKCEWHKEIVPGRKFICDYKTASDGEVHLGEKCPKCGGQLRHDVVWFEESVHDMKTRDLVRDVKYGGGAFICVGTSLIIGWAANMVAMFSQVEERYIVDLNPKPLSSYTLLKGKASETLPKLVDELLERA